MMDGEAASDPMSPMGHRRAAWQKSWCRQPFDTDFWEGFVFLRTGAVERTQGRDPITGDMARRVVRGMPARPTRWADVSAIPELKQLHDDALDGLATVRASIEAMLALHEQARMATVGLTPKTVHTTGERLI